MSFELQSAIESMFRRAMAEHKQAVEHARRSVGQTFRWAAR